MAENMYWGRGWVFGIRNLGSYTKSGRATFQSGKLTGPMRKIFFEEIYKNKKMKTTFERKLFSLNFS